MGVLLGPNAGGGVGSLNRSCQGPGHTLRAAAAETVAGSLSARLSVGANAGGGGGSSIRRARPREVVHRQS